MPFKPGPPADSQQTPELLANYRRHHASLLAHSEALGQLRSKVRESAEREASEIVTAARRDVRRVLLDARQELLVLIAQLQAVGCDPHTGPGQSSDQDTDAAFAAITDDIAGVAKEDVRGVLVEARSELELLWEQARDLRAQLARRTQNDEVDFQVIRMFPSEVAPPASTPDPEPEAAAEADGQGGLYFESTQPAAAAVARESTPPQESVSTPWPRFQGDSSRESTRAETDTSLPSLPWWMMAAGAAAFAAVAILGFWFITRDARPAAAMTTAEAAPGPQREEPAPAGPSADARTSGTTGNAPRSSDLELTLDVRKPSWIRTTVDGRTDNGRLYAAGESRIVSANQHIVVLTGNAGGVFASFNGEPSRPLGSEGSVATRRWGSRSTTPADAPPAAAASAAAPVPTTENASPPPMELARPEPVGQQEVTPPEGAGPTPSEDASPAVDNSTAATEKEIVRLTQRWFEAFFEGRQTELAEIVTANFSIADQRPQTDRMPAGATEVRRGMEQVRIDVAGDGAVLSARLIERGIVGGDVREFTSFVSTVCVKHEGRWRLMGVRFADPSKIGGMRR